MKRTICTIAILSTMLAPYVRGEEENVEENGEAVATEANKTAPKKPFHALPLCERLEGTAEVLLFGEAEWKPAEEGRAYPLGTSFRVQSKQSRMTLAFGDEARVRLVGVGFFSTSVRAYSDKTRDVILGSGEIEVELPRTLPKGAFTVSAKGFIAKDLAGDSRYVCEQLVDGDKVSVRCVTGVLSVEGRHFKVRPMRAAQEFLIRTSQDALATIIYGVSGDLTLDIDQGVVCQKDAESGETKTVEKSLEWKLTPKTSVRILRAVPDIGERLAVSVMTFNVNGELVNRCAFTERRPEVNTGELEKHEKTEEELKAEKARLEKAQSVLGNDAAEGAAETTGSEPSAAAEDDTSDSDF